MRASTEFKSHHLWTDYVYGTWHDKVFSLGPALPLYVILLMVLFVSTLYYILEFLKSTFPFFERHFTYKIIDF